MTNREPREIFGMSFTSVTDPCRHLDMVAWEDRGMLYRGVVIEFVEAGKLPATGIRQVDYRYVVGQIVPKPVQSIVAAIPGPPFTGRIAEARWVAVISLVQVNISRIQGDLRDQLHVNMMRAG